MGKAVFLFGLVYLISIPSHSSFISSSKNNFIEVGFGGTQFGYVDEFLPEYEVKPSLNLKVKFAGRIGRKPHAWFELGYQYNGAFVTQEVFTYDNGQTQVTEAVEDTYSSQSLSLGFRFTTHPYKPVAGYFRLGGGRLMTTLENQTSERFANDGSSQSSRDSIEFESDFIYGAVGLSFKINRKQRLSIDAQQNHYEFNGAQLNDNLVTFNWSKFL